MTEELSYTFQGKDGGKIRVNVEPSTTHPTSCRFSVDPAIYLESVSSWLNCHYLHIVDIDPNINYILTTTLAGTRGTYGADPAPGTSVHCLQGR